MSPLYISANDKIVLTLWFDMPRYEIAAQPGFGKGPEVSIGAAMSEHGYNSGRLNLPFVGHCTFAKRPVLTDWDRIEAEVAVLGVPNDMGTQYRSGARFGPRAIREASTLFSFGHSGASITRMTRSIWAVTSASSMWGMSTSSTPTP